MFTLKPTDRPVAAMFGDQIDNQRIYLDREEEIDEDEIDVESKWDIIRNAIKYVKKYKTMQKKDEDEIARCIFEKEYPKPSLQNVYQECLKYVKRQQGKDLYGASSKFVPLILPEKNETQMNVYNVSGNSGSGKSTFANMCLREVIKYFPNCKIYVFSRKNEDKSLDDGLEDNIVRIPCDDSFLEQELTPEDLKGSKTCPAYIVMDDYERIANPDVKNAVEKFLFTGIEIARQFNQHYIIIRHEIKNGRKSRIVNSETTHMVVFPGATPRQQLTDFLKSGLGLSPSQINNILKLPSRWVVVSKRIPQYVIYERGAYILN